jgi:hypothetical protein
MSDVCGVPGWESIVEVEESKQQLFTDTYVQ